jgi:hypothetical protein
MDLTRAAELNAEVSKEVDQMFTYQPWDDDQTARGTKVREALAAAVKVIIANVPPCLDRSSGIRLIRQARMELNSAITFRGRY